MSKELITLDEFLATEPRAHNGIIGCHVCGIDWQGPEAGRAFVEHRCLPLIRECEDCGRTFEGVNKDWFVMPSNHSCASLEDQL